MKKVFPLRSRKSFITKFLLTLSGILLFFNLSTNYSFATSFPPSGNIRYACASNNDPSNTEILRADKIAANAPVLGGYTYFNFGTSNGSFCVASPTSICFNRTYCATNEVCQNSDSKLQSVNDHTPISDTNIATCVTKQDQAIDYFTCNHPGAASTGDPKTGNGIDAILKDGSKIPGHHACPAWDYCQNVPDKNGHPSATCQPDNCQCTGTASTDSKGRTVYIGSGNNGVSCQAPDGTTVTSSCSLLQACIPNVTNLDTRPMATVQACQQLSCTCDNANSTQTGQNGFSCDGGVTGSCQGNEICTGSPRNATCTATSSAGTSKTITEFTPPPPPCNKLTSGGCTEVQTAFGLWGTDPCDFVLKLFSLLLSISGAIALIMIMIAGYQIIMSQGDPEKLQAAKEQVTAAVIGLLFLIFSLVILEVIGVNILHLPGFSGTAGTCTSQTASPTNDQVDAAACDQLQTNPNCGLTSSAVGATGLFCGNHGAGPANCSMGGRSGVLYKCQKTGPNTYKMVGKTECPNFVCNQINGAPNADACGK